MPSAPPGIYLNCQNLPFFRRTVPLFARHPDGRECPTIPRNNRMVRPQRLHKPHGVRP